MPFTPDATGRGPTARCASAVATLGIKAYDDLVAKADSDPNRDAREKLYQQAEQVLIDNASFVPLVHPVTNAVVSKDLKSDGTKPNDPGFTPLRQPGLYVYTHVTQ